MSRPVFALFSLIALALVAFLLLGCVQFEPAPPPSVPSYAPLPLPPYTPPQTLPVANETVAPVVPFETSFIDVGFGDATLIRSANFTMLIDDGPAGSADSLIAFLRAKNVERIDVLVLSASDPNSVGGTPAITRKFPVREVWTNGVNYSDPFWQSIEQQIQFTPQKAVQYGDNFSYGNLTFTILNPQVERMVSNPQADSIAMKVSYGSFCALLFSQSEAAGASGGDPGTVVGGMESRILFGSVPIACPVLKVSHYGSGNSASFQFLERVKPKIGIISVGPNPRNLYPEPALIRRLMLKNMSVYVTDKLGSITLSSDGALYSIRTEKPVDEDYTRFINNVGDTRLYWTP